MRAKHFFSKLEHTRISQAIQEAETGTSGNIVIYISHHVVPDALAAAQATFTKRHLDQAADDDSLLIFLAPQSRTFAVVGGKALHERVGQAWWDSLIEILREHFIETRYTDGLVAAIEQAGRALKQHFPGVRAGHSARNDLVEE